MGVKRGLRGVLVLGLADQGDQLLAFRGPLCKVPGITVEDVRELAPASVFGELALFFDGGRAAFGFERPEQTQGREIGFELGFCAGGGVGFVVGDYVVRRAFRR